MDNNIAKNLKSLRELYGYNQDVIAKFLGVDQSLVSKIEKGERSVSIDLIEKLSSLYGIKVSDLENGDFEKLNISTSFRKNDLDSSDLDVISKINKICLNIEFMEELLNGEENAR